VIEGTDDDGSYCTLSALPLGWRQRKNNLRICLQSEQDQK
jgi:hypothetical protein